MIGALLLFGRRMFFPLCAAVTVAVVILQQLAVRSGVDVSGFFFDGYWLAFAFGIAAFYSINCLTLTGRVVVGAVLLVAPWLLAICRGLDNPEYWVASAFAVALIALRPWDETLGKARVLKPLYVCGTMCYSLYLVHSVLVAGISRVCYWSGLDSAWETLLVTVPLCLAVSLPAGWAFYALCERKFLNSTAGVVA